MIIFVDCISPDRYEVVPEATLELVRDDIDCVLCMQLLHRPATLACGHVLCSTCLARTMDHAFDREPECPYDTSQLKSYFLCFYSVFVSCIKIESVSEFTNNLLMQVLPRSPRAIPL